MTCSGFRKSISRLHRRYRIAVKAKLEGEGPAARVPSFGGVESGACGPRIRDRTCTLMPPWLLGTTNMRSVRAQRVGAGSGTYTPTHECAGGSASHRTTCSSKAREGTCTLPWPTVGSEDDRTIAGFVDSANRGAHCAECWGGWTAHCRRNIPGFPQGDCRRRAKDKTNH